MKITIVDDGAIYKVFSDSGKIYTVKYCGSGDADPDYVSLWECNCPAGRHGKDCKHLEKTLALMNYIDEDNAERFGWIFDGQNSWLKGGRSNES